MDFSVKEALHFIVTWIVVFIMMVSLGQFIQAMGRQSENKSINDSVFIRESINQPVASGNEPVLYVDKIYLSKDQEFNMDMLKNFARAIDYNGNDISENIQIRGSVDISVAGIYEVKFYVEDSSGRKTAYIKNVIVS